MDVMDLLSAAGGNKSLGQLARNLGLGSDDTSKLVSAVAPALMRGIQRNTATDDGLAGFRHALETGNHQRYLDDPDALTGAAGVADGNKILGHIFGSKDVSRNVAGQAAENTGISVGLIKKALPMLAGLAMGVLSKKSGGGSELGKSSSNGGLGPLAGLIDEAGDGVGLDDVLGLAKKFF